MHVVLARPEDVRARAGSPSCAHVAVPHAERSEPRSRSTGRPRLNAPVEMTVHFGRARPGRDRVAGDARDGRAGERAVLRVRDRVLLEGGRLDHRPHPHAVGALVRGQGEADLPALEKDEHHAAPGEVHPSPSRARAPRPARRGRARTPGTFVNVTPRTLPRRSRPGPDQPCRRLERRAPSRAPPSARCRSRAPP